MKFCPTDHACNLPVLNVSGNVKITDLPPQMGLLQKLWNLNTRGCNLQEPLATMMNSKSYKTADVIGYLRQAFLLCTFLEVDCGSNLR